MQPTPVESPVRDQSRSAPGEQGAGHRVILLLTRHPLLSVFIVALVVRVTTAAAIHLAIGADFFGVGDDTTYSQMAADVAAGATAHWDGYTRLLYNITATFTVPLTVIYLVFGPTILGGPVLAAFFGAATAALVTRIALEALPVRWALSAGLGVTFFPSQVLWSSLTLKDAAVWAVLAGLGVVVAVANRADGRALALSGAGAAVGLVLLGHLRLHTLIVACVALGLAAWVGVRRQRAPRIAGALLLAVSIPWFLGLGPGGVGLVTSAGRDLENRRVANAFGAATALVPDVPPAQTEGAVALTELEARVAVLDEELRELDEERLAAREPAGGAEPPADPGLTPAERRALANRRRQLERERHLAVERAAALRLEAAQQPEVPAAEEVGSPHLAHLPRGLSAMLLEPYPWRSSPNSRVAVARLESFLWYPLLAFAMMGLTGLWRERRVLAYPVLVGGGILLMYALAEGNFGTAYRHRGEFVWVVILLATFGAYHSRAWYRRFGE